MKTMVAYLAQDRRQALAAGADLPARAHGSVLFADISGWTPLTALLTRTLGPRQGIDELTQQLNQVYQRLVECVDAYGGSVVHFAGDGITCWFADDAGLRAIRCALAMQAHLPPPAQPGPSAAPVALTLRAAITSGTLQRVVVGDPRLHVLDILVGQALNRLGLIEGLAAQHEVVVDAVTLADCAPAGAVAEWRSVAAGALQVGVLDPQAFLAALPAPPAPGPQPEPELEAEELRPWLLPAVFNQLATGQGEFLTELRPAAVLFARFAGLDYERDPAAPATLDRYLRDAQAIIQRYDGALLSLHTDAVGNVLCAAFGAPTAHQDDAWRAVAAADELRQMTAASAVTALQIGISHGIVRAGAYGAPQRRTYGVLGDEVNLAARAMGQAAPGQILASAPIQAATAALARWHALPPRQLKGKEEPIALFRLDAISERDAPGGHGPRSPVAMVGRAAEMALIADKLGRAARGRGQVVAVIAEAGMGKSRLLAEACQRAASEGWTIYGGACQSYGATLPYAVWQPIWRAVFGITATLAPRRQRQQLARRVALLDPALLPRLPLLATVLNLPLAESALTRDLDPAIRKQSLEALLIDCLRATVRRAGGPILLALDDCHWIDPLSQDLLVRISRAMTALPVAVIAAARPFGPEQLPLAQLAALPHGSEIRLRELPPAEMSGLLAALLQHAGRALPAALGAHLIERSQGIPFYLEELVRFVAEQPVPRASMELPTSLQSLILSRVDRLSARQKVTVKIASIIGRLFRAPWLWGYQPALGAPAAVLDDLATLSLLDITPLETPEPEPTYLFKHAITHDVVYDSMPPTMRAALHEQLAVFLEAGPQPEQRVPLLALHYARSGNAAKHRHYARRAGAAAQAAADYATALAYYTDALPGLEEAEEQADVRFQLGAVTDILGQWPVALQHYAAILAQVDAGLLDPRWRARCLYASGSVRSRQGDYGQALADLTEAELASRGEDDRALRAAVLTELATLKWRQGALDEGQAHLDLALRLALAAEDRPAVARIYSVLANLTYAQGALEPAAAYQRQSYDLYQALGNRSGMAASLINLGMAEMISHDQSAARRLFEQALDLMQAIGDLRGVMICWLNIATADYRRSAWEEALQGYRQSLGLISELGDLLAFSYALLGLGAVLAARDEPADAALAIRALAAAQANAAALSAVLEPYEQEMYDQAVMRLRERLAADAFAAAWAEALAQPLAATVAAALGEA